MQTTATLHSTAILPAKAAAARTIATLALVPICFAGTTADADAAPRPQAPTKTTTTRAATPKLTAPKRKAVSPKRATPVSLSVRSCETALRRVVLPGWRVSCPVTVKRNTVAINSQTRTVTVPVALFMKSPSKVSAETRFKVAAALPPFDKDACAQDVMKSLPTGWVVECATNPNEVSADAEVGVVKMDPATYADDPATAKAMARIKTDGAPLPTVLSERTRRCDDLIADLRKRAPKADPQGWTVKCVDESEMPGTAGLSEAGFQRAGGLTYRRARIILINAGVYDGGIINIFHHEWGHALNEMLPVPVRRALETSSGLPWNDFRDIYNSVNETVAQSYAECMGAPINPAYPSMSCRDVQRLYADHGIHADLPGRSGFTTAERKVVQYSR